MARSPQKQSYIGSVRFFRHLFLLLLLSAIIVPTVLGIVNGVRFRSQKDRNAELISQIGQLQEQLKQAQARQVQLPKQSAPQEASADEEDPLDAQAPAYTQLYPDFYAQAEPVPYVDDTGVCYLTFDDGPSVCTEEVLDILEQEQIKATFFVVKNDTETGREQLKAAARAGHTVGMHTASHDYSNIYTSVEAYLADLYEVYSWILEQTGQAPVLFRFPGGSINAYNRSIYQELIAEMLRRGFLFYDWNMAAADAAGAGLSTAAIIDNCTRGMEKHGRVVLLMHDSSAKQTTVAALSTVIQRYRDAGFTFAALSPEVRPYIFSYVN